jgi:hypothetical protein
MPIQNSLSYLAKFLKKTTYRHKKKVITLVIIALLTLLIKKKVQIIHLIYLVNKITTILSYIPLPKSP